jgi:hypothetical protein
MAEVSTRSWADIVDFYRDLIRETGWRQEPMLAFVSWLGSSMHGQVLFPNTSHEALGLATVPTYEERLRLPMVSIVYHEREGQFVVVYQECQGRKVREEIVESPQAPDVLIRILDWLGLPAQIPT